MDKELLIEKINEYKRICNNAVEKAIEAKENIHGGINWSDLYCFEAKYTIDEAGLECYDFFITEADPDNEELKDFLYDEMFKYIGDNIPIRIITEW